MPTDYCFDTSAFVNPWRRYYPRDLFSSVWVHLDQCIASGRIVASHEVGHELEQKDDELLAYIKTQTGLLVPLDDQQQSLVGEIVNTFPSWVNPESTKNSADPFIVALARQRRLTIVTYEKKVGAGSSQVKIPNVCDHFGVPWVDFLKFMRDTGYQG